MRKFLIVIISVVGAMMHGHASLPFASDADCDSISQILVQLRDIAAGNNLDSPALRLPLAAKSLEGAREDTKVATDSSYAACIDLHNMTPIGFVAMSMAIAKDTDPRLPKSADAFKFNEDFQNFYLRKGIDNGFPSIIWHASDWISDNLYRGNIGEVTQNIKSARSKTKSLDYLTRHRDEFAPLRNDSIYEIVRMHEMGFRNHLIPMLPKSAGSQEDVISQLRNGDILLLIDNEDGRDLYTIGILNESSDGFHLIHMSPENSLVIEEKQPLGKYLKSVIKKFSGLRVLRMN